MKRHILLAALAAALAASLPAVAETPHDPVVILGAADEFIVTEGSAALGCSAGTTLISHGSLPPGLRGSFVALLTCTVGGTGTIMINFEPANGKPGPNGDNNVGQWNVTDATGSFLGLKGRGDFAYYPDSYTFIGLIHY